MIDDIDRQILVLLQKNARTSNAEIAREVGMAPSATMERLRKMEDKGVIEGYTVNINPLALNLGTLAFVYVSSRDTTWCETTFNELQKINEVQECHSIAGEDCFLIKVRARDTQHLNAILRDKIAAIDTVNATRTTIVLETNKESLNLPMENAT